MMNNPKITVYIPSHNYGKFLEEAVESVLRQSFDEWELLIIDDNSTDNTKQVMELYRGDSRIRLFSTDGIGLPAVCNLALREAKGEYIIRLDGDDIFDENIVIVLNNYLDRHEECALVFPDYYLMDELGDVFAHERREKLYVNNHVLDIPANGACSLIRKKVLVDLGGYREDLGVQDGYDLWNKLIGKYKLGNVNLPLFYYRRHNQNITNRSNHILSARRQIKLDNISEKLKDYRPISVVIPCRRNYDFCLDLWKQEVQGKSLLQMNIEKCIRSKAIDHIIVASDNINVKNVISLFHDKRLSFYKRIENETIRSFSLAPTIEKIIAPIDAEWRGLTAISYLQAPFVTTGTLEEAIYTLILNGADCAFGVEELKHPLFKRTAHGLQPINSPKGFLTDFDVIYREANTSLATKNSNLKTGSLTGPSIVNFIVSSEECFFINSEQNLKIAEIIAGGH